MITKFTDRQRTARKLLRLAEKQRGAERRVNALGDNRDAAAARLGEYCRTQATSFDNINDNNESTRYRSDFYLSYAAFEFYICFLFHLTFWIYKNSIKGECHKKAEEDNK